MAWALFEALRDNPPRIVSVKCSQSNPISGVVHKYRNLTFDSPVTLHFLAKITDDKGVSSVEIQLFDENHTMTRESGLYTYDMILGSLTPTRLSVPYVVYAVDTIGQQSNYSGKAALSFKDVIIEGVPHYKGGCGASTVRMIMGYWGTNLTEEQIDEAIGIGIWFRRWIEWLREYDFEEAGISPENGFCKFGEGTCPALKLSQVIALGFPTYVVVPEHDYPKHDLVVAGFRDYGKLFLFYDPGYPRSEGVYWSSPTNIGPEGKRSFEGMTTTKHKKWVNWATWYPKKFSPLTELTAYP